MGGTPYDPRQGGRLVLVEYHRADRPVSKPNLLSNAIVASVLAKHTSPTLLQSNGANFTQIYLARLDDVPVAQLLLELLDLPPQMPASSVFGSQEDRTVAEQLVLARLGQGKFRKDLITLWNGRCAITGLNVEELLVASHVKPWRQSSNSERLDPHNGLLLAAGVDKAFDKLFISFDENGQMHSKLNEKSLRCLGIWTEAGRLPRLRSTSAALAGYLEHHYFAYTNKQ